MNKRSVWICFVSILVSACVFAQEADVRERRLDSTLKLLYRAQAAAQQAKGNEASVPMIGSDHAREILDRIRGRLSGKYGKVFTQIHPQLLNLLVKYAGEQSKLEAVGFHVQSKIGNIYTGTLDPQRLTDLVSLQEIHFIQSSQKIRASFLPLAEMLPLNQPQLAHSPYASIQPQNMVGSGVIIASIDTGVDIFHQDFRKPDGSTRIKYLLDLSDPGDVDGDGDLDGAGPFGGTLYIESEINAALLSSGTVNEKDITGHGTHALSIASGDDATLPGVAPSADLIVVKATREDGSLGFWSTDIMNALSFVDQKAGELGEPYVVNLSLGTIFCSHDGRSLEEEAIDALTGAGIAGKVIVTAAGNSSETRTAHYHHFQGTSLVGIDSSHTLTLPSYTPNPGKGNDRALLDLWYKGRDQDSISVTAPDGLTKVTAVYGQYADEQTAFGDVFIANMGGANPANGDTEAIILIDDWSGTPPAAGNWTITVRGQEIDDSGRYDGWLADESVIGSIEPYLSAGADNLSLVGKPGGAYNSITVGSYGKHSPSSRYLITWSDVNSISRTDSTAIDGDISDFSSTGTTRDGRIKPELAAPGERVLGAVSKDAYPGISPTSIYKFHPFPQIDALITDNTSNHSFGMLQGTSFSAPVVTGMSARILSTNPTLDAINVRNILINSAVADSFTGAVPNNLWGYGKVDETIGGSPLPSDLRITVDALPGGLRNQQYNFVLTASGGTLPYSWSVTSGLLPDGLTLVNGGFITGKPTNAGTYNFTIQVVDTSIPTQTSTKNFSIVITANPPLHIVTNTFPNAKIDKPYSEQLEAEGGTPPYSWSVAGGSLPPGLVLSNIGLISGSATTLGRYNFTIEVTDSVAGTSFRSMKIKVTGQNGDDWVALGKNTASSINAIAIDPTNPNHAFCSSVDANAVFETTNGGDSWHDTTTNKSVNEYARDIAFNPVTGGSFMYTEPFRWTWSFDSVNGLWQPYYQPSQPPYIGGYKAIGFDASGEIYRIDYNNQFLQDPGQILGYLGVIGSEGMSIYGFDGNISVFRQNPSYVYATATGKNPIVCCGTGTLSYVFASWDHGASWAIIVGAESRLVGGYVFAILVSQSDPFDVIHAWNTTTPNVSRSTNGGQSFASLPFPAQSPLISFDRDPNNPAVLWAGTSGGLLRSSDNGNTWASIPVGGQVGSVTAVAIDPVNSDHLFVGSANGLHETADGGQTWIGKNNGLIRHRINFVVISESSPSELLIQADVGTYLSRSSGNRWTTTSVPGGSVRISRSDPNIYYALASQNMYRSNNRGVTWSLRSGIFDPSTHHAVGFDSDMFDSGILIATTNSSLQFGAFGHVYRSTDGGDSWSIIISGLPFKEPGDIGFARDVSGKAYLSMGDNGIYVSNDHGATWSPYALNGQTIDKIQIPPSDSSYLYAHSIGGPGTTASNGWMQFDPTIGTWQRFIPPSNVTGRFTIDPLSPSIAYWGALHTGTVGATGGIYKTTDSGTSWNRLAGVLDFYSVSSVAIDPSATNVLYASTLEGGVFKSTDTGLTWTELANYGTVADLTNVNVQDPSNPFLLFAGTEGYGVQASTDKGKNYAPRVNGLTNFYVNALAFDPDTPSTLYAGTNNGVFKSTNSGNNWAPTALTSGKITDILTDNEGTGKRVWTTVVGQGVAYSSDGGATFTIYNQGLSSLELTGLELENIGAGKRVWTTMKGGDGIAYSDDLGQTWHSAAGNGLTDRDANDVKVEKGVGKRVWTTTDTGVFFSDNHGLSWNELSRGLPSGIPVTSISIDPNTNEALVSLFSEDAGGVYRGGNINGVWTPFNSGLEELRVKTLTSDNGHVIDASTLGTTLYASTSGDGVYATELQTANGSAPTITTARLHDGLFRRTYSDTLLAQGGAPPYTWSIQEQSLPPGLQLDSASGAITGEPGQLGVYEFTIQVSDNTSRIARKDLSIRILSPDDLNVTFCDPQIGIRGNTLDVTINGSSFVDGASANFGTGITVNSVIFVSQYQLTANVSIDGNATPGWRNVSVTVPGPTTASLSNGFKVDFPTPQITSLSPPQGSTKDTLNVDITGAFFDNGATAGFGAGITVNSVTYVNASKLTANITIAVAAVLGFRNITVTNPNLLSVVGSNAFEVKPARPTVTSVSPVQGNVGTTVNVTIAGNDFQNGASSNFGAEITVNSTTFNSSSQLTANITIGSGAALGYRTVAVTNPDALQGSLANAFRVIAPAPQIFSLAPSQGVRGTTLSVDINGANFQNGASSTFGAGITVNSTSFVTVSKLTASIAIDLAASLGGRSVTVTNGDSQSVTFNDGFQVVAPAPLTLSPLTLPGGTLGIAYNQTITASGGTGSYSFSVTTGLLPNGLTLSSGGVISGTPTVGGTFNFTVRATDASANTGSQTYTIIVCANITLSPSSLPGGTVGSFYGVVVSATGGLSPYSYVLTSGTLPDGIGLSTTGLLLGVPTGSGNFSLSVAATDANNCAGTKAYNLIVAPVAGCVVPTQRVYLYSVTLDINYNPVLNMQDPNQPSSITGYDVYRASTAQGPWVLVGSNVVDMDQGTPNIQWVDFSGDPGTFYYQVAAYNSYCPAEGPW